jgi:hypothetical protein
MEATSRRQKRMGASSQGDQGPRRGCGTTDGWKDGHCQTKVSLLQYINISPRDSAEVQIM